jgi:23S rRNA (guanosine2251-2'-O)-methyltransferase
MSSSNKPPFASNRNRPASDGRSDNRSDGRTEGRHEGRGGRGPKQRDQRGKAAPEGGPVLIWGSHAVEAALRNDARDIFRILMTDTGEDRMKEALAARHAMTSAVQGRLRVERTTPQVLDKRLGDDTVHQGVLLEVAPLDDIDLETIADRIAANPKAGPLLVLDQVTDPHNVGAILRSAAVFGAAAVVMTRRNSPPLGGVLAKSASGALELIPVVLVANLSRALTDLGKLGFHRIGLAGDGGTDLEAVPLVGNLAIVLGAEGRGMRHLTEQTCDQLARIQADSPLASLNVSNAAAVALHLASMRRREGKTRKA